MSDNEQPADAPATAQTRRPVFIPFVGFETMQGQIVLRRWDLIRGLSCHVDNKAGDPVVVYLAGEKEMMSRTSPESIAAQVRACEHYSKTREVDAGIQADAIINGSRSGIVVPR